MITLDQIAKKYETNKKHYQSKRSSLRQQLEQQIEIQTINALKIQNHKVSEIHKNQKVIETKLKRNNEVKAEIQKQLNSWSSIYQQLNKSLKKAGDLAHYANFIQDEINEVSFSSNPDNDGLSYKSKLTQLQD